jgi:Negative regulator of sigma F
MDSGRPEYLAPRLAPEMHRGRQPLPPLVRAILWLDGVLVVAALLALGGMPPALANASTWSWIALGGSTLTAALAALSAFELSVPGRRSYAWMLLPAPALVLWLAGSGMGCLAGPGGTDAWGDTVAEAGRCLGFLLMISAPLLTLILVMLWRASPRVPGRMLAMAALASAGAAASLLAFVHPHDAGLLDLGAHALAIAVVLGVSGIVARFRSASAR